MGLVPIYWDVNCILNYSKIAHIHLFNIQLIIGWHTLKNVSVNKKWLSMKEKKTINCFQYEIM